jgi:hypothetical protein
VMIAAVMARGLRQGKAPHAQKKVLIISLFILIY